MTALPYSAVWRNLPGYIFFGLLPVVLIVCVFLPTALPQARGPLSKSEVLDLLKNDVRPARVATLVRQFGISFALDPEAKTELTRAGATAELLDALRQAPREAAPPPRETTGSVLIEGTPGAKVYADGNLVGTTNGEGRLEVDRLAAGDHVLLVALPGYQDYEQKASVLPGQTVRVALPKPTPIPSPLPPPHSVLSFRAQHQHMLGSCHGLLTIGDGRIRYHADNGKDSFDFPLSDITFGSVRIGGGFYLQPKGDKNYFFHSASTPEILQELQRTSGH